MCNYRVSDLDFTLNCYKALRGDTSVRPRELYTPHHPPAPQPACGTSCSVWLVFATHAEHTQVPLNL